jgi:hypothetical protein
VSTIGTTSLQAKRRFDSIHGHPVLGYFLLAFTVSWAGALIQLSPRFVRGETLPKFTGLMIFPAMLLARLSPV